MVKASKVSERIAIFVFWFRTCFVRFLNISTSKAAWTWIFFTIFTSTCCFPPQAFHILISKCASRHKTVHFLNISISKRAPKISEVFLPFDSERCFAPRLRASCHKGVQFFISHLAKWLRTRCFSEPTFRASGTSKHWEKHTVARLYYFFTHLDLVSIWLFLFSDSSRLCFIAFPSVHIVGSLTSKLLSIQHNYIKITVFYPHILHWKDAMTPADLCTGTDWNVGVLRVSRNGVYHPKTSNFNGDNHYHHGLLGGVSPLGGVLLKKKTHWRACMLALWSARQNGTL